MLSGVDTARLEMLVTVARRENEALLPRAELFDLGANRAERGREAEPSCGGLVRISRSGGSPALPGRSAEERLWSRLRRSTVGRRGRRRALLRAGLSVQSC